MERIARRIDAVNLWIGRVVRWLALAMVVVQFALVLLRYVYGISYIALDESVLYMHATLFMLAAGYTLMVDGHVRVDIFYARAGARGKAIVDAAGHAVLLIPAMVALIYWSWASVANSWAILEGPLSVGGIPAVFLLKSLIPAFAVLLILQSVACLLRAAATLARPRA